MFHQDGPRLAHPYAADDTLRAILRRTLPPDVRRDVEPGLARLGDRALGEMRALADDAESHPPVHVPFDPWGRRVDRIETSAGWRALDRIAAEEGIVATAYERAHGALSRVHQAARLYLYHPSSAIYSCPLAMTDGAARCLELFGGEELALRRVLAHLTARDPDVFWTSGQWMTERTGGSDVSGTTTVARPLGDDLYALHGVKWFTSATTAQVAMTLGRIIADDDDRAEHGAGSGRELSLFLVELRDDAGALQGIRVERLKDKLGTRALPTAELTLGGARARLVGGAGHGVRKIAAMLNVTRYYNAVCAASGMRRAVALARDYAGRRVAFGRALIDHPLHRETLAWMEVETQAATQLVMHVARLLGRDECGEATDAERALLRVLTPVAKLYTGRRAVAVASEALEAFGGAGYVEDTGLPRLLRDAQVLSIWEGTTNVLSLDVLRALSRDASLDVVLDDVRRRIELVRLPGLAGSVDRLRAALPRVVAHAGALAREGPEAMEAGARAFACALARCTCAALMLEHAQWAADAEGDERPALAAARWCDDDLAPLPVTDAAHRAATAALVRAEGASPLAEPRPEYTAPSATVTA